MSDEPLHVIKYLSQGTSKRCNYVNKYLLSEAFEYDLHQEPRYGYANHENLLEIMVNKSE